MLKPSSFFGLTPMGKRLIWSFMFGIGGQELILILLLALIVLGPRKLPEMAKTIGKALGEFQRATDDLKKEIDVASRQKPAEPASKPVPEEDEQEPAAEETAPPTQEEVSSDNGETASEKKVAGDDSPVYRPGEIEG